MTAKLGEEYFLVYIMKAANCLYKIDTNRYIDIGKASSRLILRSRNIEITFRFSNLYGILNTHKLLRRISQTAKIINNNREIDKISLS